MREPFGFIIVRHMSNETHSLYWKECVKCIQRHYTNPYIVIIDDHSTYMDDAIEINMTNITIITSEFPGAGEILGYYYGWKYRWFQTFVVLHDSMFLQGPFPELKDDLLFLWHFSGENLGTPNDHYCNGIFRLILLCDIEQRRKLLDLYYNKAGWFGCFGLASIITLDVIDIFFSKYGLLECIKNIKSRLNRIEMERVFALIAYQEFADKINKPSLLGDINGDYPNSFHTTWEDYNNGRRENILVNKVWSGR